MSKRIVAALLLIVMVVGLFAGCSNQTGTNNGTNNNGNNGSNTATPNFDVPEVGYDGSAVTITFYHTMGANLREVLDAYIVDFNKLYPNITIVSTQVGGYDDVRDTISTEILAGNQPNIAYCYPDHVAMYNEAEAVTSLDNLIASTIEITRADGTKEIVGLTQAQKDDFIEGYYNEGKQFGDGLMYTMPLSKSTEVLYYNKTFFDEHKLTVPTTWDELEKVCEQIKAIDPESIPLGYDSEANWFITMCEQLKSDYTSASGDHFLFDNDTNRAFIERFNSWYQKGYLTTQTLYKAYTSGLFTATSGTKSYMSIGSSAGATHQRPDMVDGAYPFEVGIATIPQADASNKKVISQGPSLCIFQKENPQEVVASWLFVKFLTTNVDFQAEFSMASGYMPVLESVTNNPTYASWLSKGNGYEYLVAKCVQVGIDGRADYFVSPAFKGSSTARAEAGSLLIKCVKGDPDGDLDAFINQAFKDALDECEY